MIISDEKYWNSLRVIFLWIGSGAYPNRTKVKNPRDHFIWLRDKLGPWTQSLRAHTVSVRHRPRTTTPVRHHVTGSCNLSVKLRPAAVTDSGEVISTATAMVGAIRRREWEMYEVSSASLYINLTLFIWYYCKLCFFYRV